MKHLNKIIMSAMMAAGIVFSSCSKDEKAPVVIPPSREIEQVKVYKGSSEEFKLMTVMKFEYKGKGGKLSLIESASPFSQVTYRYEDDKFSYTHAYKLSDGSDKVNVVSSTLVNGRINFCSSKLLGNCVYTYNEATGLLSQASVGSNIILNYKWTDKKLDLEATSSTEPLVETIYSTEYNFSDIPNNYSIDLNIFPQLVDLRDQFSLIMNSYAQAAGVLGKKYAYVMEAEGYSYSYSFDKNGRLAQLTVIPNIYGESYNFVFLYKENK